MFQFLYDYWDPIAPMTVALLILTLLTLLCEMMISIITVGGFLAVPILLGIMGFTGFLILSKNPSNQTEF